MWLPDWILDSESEIGHFQAWPVQPSQIRSLLWFFIFICWLNEEDTKDTKSPEGKGKPLCSYIVLWQEHEIDSHCAKLQILMVVVEAAGLFWWVWWAFLFFADVCRVCEVWDRQSAELILVRALPLTSWWTQMVSEIWESKKKVNDFFFCDDDTAAYLPMQRLGWERGSAKPLEEDAGCLSPSFPEAWLIAVPSAQHTAKIIWFRHFN